MVDAAPFVILLITSVIIIYMSPDQMVSLAKTIMGVAMWQEDGREAYIGKDGTEWVEAAPEVEWIRAWIPSTLDWLPISQKRVRILCSQSQLFITGRKWKKDTGFRGGLWNKNIVVFGSGSKHHILCYSECRRECFRFLSAWGLNFTRTIDHRFEKVKEWYDSGD